MPAIVGEGRGEEFVLSWTSGRFGIKVFAWRRQHKFKRICRRRCVKRCVFKTAL